MIGQKIGLVTIIAAAAAAEQGGRLRRMWRCVCACGKLFDTRADKLKAGNIHSCGCANPRKLKHGRSRTPTYKSWLAMIQRCSSKTNKDYGGRGIRVCERWNDFENFLFDMGERPSRDHSIERNDVNGNYSPVNCCWIESAKQNRNRRNNRVLVHNGEARCLAEWAERLGLSPDGLAHRLNRGWGTDRALSLSRRRPFGRDGVITKGQGT